MSLRSTIMGSGGNMNIEAQVDPSFDATRINIRPLEYTDSSVIGGHYYMAATFTNTAGQPNVASQQLFSLRWADTRMLFVLKRVIISAGYTTVPTGTSCVDCDIIRATAFSTNPSGGNTITLSTNSQKARSAAMSGSLLATSGAIQISSGSALTAGTQTLDTQPFGYAIVLQASTTPANLQTSLSPIPIYEYRDFGAHPMIFGANEGFVIRNGAAYQSAAVVRMGFTIQWCECPTY